MALLSLSFLGTFQVVLAERPITRFRSVNVQGLLVYLAMHRDRAIGREVLATLLWPEEPDSVAKKNLRQSLYQLRKLLAAGEDEERPFLIVTRESVQFNPDCDHVVDVVAFLQAIEDGDLAGGVSQYKGDLLPGFNSQSLEFEAWLRGERERLHQIALESLFILCEQKLAYGKSAYAEAQDIARRQLFLEPWREEAHRQLMQALALSGNRSAAISQYESCVDVLAEELGIPPSLETKVVYEAILNNELIPEVTLEPGGKMIPDNLPRQTTPFIGREDELTQLTSMLVAGDKPLITLSGPGGMGKTSLVLNAGRNILQTGLTEDFHFPDGIFFVRLDSLSDPAKIPMAIADAVGFRFQGRSELFEQISGYLSDKKMLMILDNFEHLMEWAGSLNSLLQKAKSVQFCVTSRQRLNLRSEVLFLIAGLDVPDDFGVPKETSAEKLFLQSVRRIMPGFDPTPEESISIAQICCQVNGLPLAIVLAAGWVDMMPLVEIAAEIQQDFDFLATDLKDIPERQRSLRATFDYSWKLLNPMEREQYVRLSVFRGGFTREAVTSVANLPRRLMARLVNRSLLQYDPGNDRYQIHELLRQFCEEKLRQIDVELPSVKGISEASVRRTHGRYYLELAGKRHSDLLGRYLEDALAEISADYENIRAAWDWAVENGKISLLERASDSIFRYHRVRSLLAEGSRMIAEAVDAIVPLLETDEGGEIRSVYGRLLGHQGMLIFFLGDSKEATRLLEASVDILQDTGFYEALISPLNHLAYVKFCADLYDEALTMGEKAINLSEEIVDPFNLAYAHRTIGSIFSARGDFVKSKEHYELALTLSNQIGDQRGEGLALNRLGITARMLNDHKTAESKHRQSLKIFREIGDRQGEGQVLNRLGVVKWYQGDFEAAKEFFEQALVIGRGIGDWQLIGANLHRIGNYRWNHGQHSAAVSVYEEVVDMYHRIGDRQSEGYVLDNLALLSLYDGQDGETLDYCQRVMEIADDIHLPPLKGYSLITLGHAYLKQDQLSVAADYYGKALKVWQDMGRARPSIQPMAGMALIALREGRSEEALRLVEEILVYLKTDDLKGSDEPLRVYDICIQVLGELNDPRFGDLLTAAFDRLQSWAATISDPTDRKAFLENVPFHRRIVESWEQYSRQVGGAD